MRPTVGQLALAAATTLLAALVAAPAAAQLSPGPLSRAHAELEGSANCLSCHQAQTGVDAGRCLECHEPLARRIEARLGLHAGDGYQRCERCHIEHHGRDFELVWWGEEGRESFDHTLAGFVLEGAHARAECGQCHRPGAIVEAAELEAARKDLTRTFLGLDRACLSCHEDAHHGQFAADSCVDCHGFESWSPAIEFDHEETLFPLTGLHRDLGCASCHRLESGEAESGASWLHFDVERFASCADCHLDPHAGRLGPRCENCHSTAGWSRVPRAAFDHDRTRFALTGAHVEVACESCHLQGSGFRVRRFELCSDCHRDRHLGQFVSESGTGACSSCHTTQAFVPSSFTLIDHQRSDFALEGAHLAVPCIGCHRQVALAELAPGFHGLTAPPDPSITSVRQFRFLDTACADCHGDPHEGSLADASCESCHQQATWRAITFDHGTTALPLRGAHAELVCRSCHAVASRAGTPPVVRFDDASASCATCHEDPHRGQFADYDRPVACVGCHDETGWTELLFDHDRDARFRLAGGHLRLACADCHPTESYGEHLFVRYRPISRTCEACHAAEPP